MMVVGIDDVGPKDQQAGGDLVIGEVASRAEHFEPAVIVDELFSEIRLAVGLPAAEIVPMLGKQPHQRLGIRRRQFHDAIEMAQAGKRMRLQRAGGHVPADPRHGIAHQGVIDGRKVCVELPQQIIEFCRHVMLRTGIDAQPLPKWAVDGSGCAAASLV
ncbi:hypothetical protein X743_05690 [Mesorhizobium sp. LNHC252B00]|nr:hypothetical protein X743_05690 [Mesorhizobium sp. LNHC252B00]